MMSTYLSSAEVIELTNLLKLIRELQGSSEFGVTVPTEAIHLLRQQAEKFLGKLELPSSEPRHK